MGRELHTVQKGAIDVLLLKATKDDMQDVVAIKSRFAGKGSMVIVDNNPVIRAAFGPALFCVIENIDQVHQTLIKTAKMNVGAANAKGRANVTPRVAIKAADVDDADGTLRGQHASEVIAAQRYTVQRCGRHCPGLARP